MTPTEKDAMALAVLDAAAVDTEHTLGCPNLAGRLREARAHLASRIAELEGERNEYRADAEIANARATRAEAELAAVKVNADRYIFIRDDPSAGVQIMVDGSLRELFGDELDAAVDAARGGE